MRSVSRMIAPLRAIWALQTTVARVPARHMLLTWATRRATTAEVLAFPRISVTHGLRTDIFTTSLIPHSTVPAARLSSPPRQARASKMKHRRDLPRTPTTVFYGVCPSDVVGCGLRFGSGVIIISRRSTANSDFTFVVASGLMFSSTGWVAVLCDHGLTNGAFSFCCCDETSRFRHCYIMFTI